MSEDPTNLLPAPDVESKSPAPNRRADTARGGSGAATVLALLALIVGGVALWRAYVVEHGQADAQSGLRSEFAARIDELARGEQQRKRDFDSLRTRLADADGVNKSMREEMLGLGERSRHLEDAVANLAEQRLTGRDALALNEAEFLLQQAQERLALFQDAQAAIAAYKLADSALAVAEDPVFSSVRQTIGAELRALEASKPVETHAAISAIERVRAALPGLPTERAPFAESASPSRWQSFFAQFVRITHANDADTGASRDVGLNRSLAAVDLRAAEIALLARDAGGYKAALARASAGIVAGFDAQAAPTRDALAELDRIAAQPLAPALPELGSALKDLRNLRATRALAQPRPATPVQTPTTDDKRGASSPKQDEADA
ncbi:MAG: uroporphyrinogen-III C-methyltransferase [Dokdonella sp.]